MRVAMRCFDSVRSIIHFRASCERFLIKRSPVVIIITTRFAYLDLVFFFFFRWREMKHQTTVQIAATVVLLIATCYACFTDKYHIFVIHPQEGPHSTLPEDEFFDAVETGLDKIEEDVQMRVRLKLQSQQVRNPVCTYSSSE